MNIRLLILQGEALDFNKKLGFYVEFERKGFDKNSVFYFLRNKVLQIFMLIVVEFTIKRMIDLKLKGSLFIHANIWPDNSDMWYEHDLHYKHGWLAYGNLFEFKNVWNEYIIIEKLVKNYIDSQGGNWKNSSDQRKILICQMQEKLGNQSLHGGNQEIARKTINVLDGQANLSLMQGRLTSRRKLLTTA